MDLTPLQKECLLALLHGTLGEPRGTLRIALVAMEVKGLVDGSRTNLHWELTEEGYEIACALNAEAIKPKKGGRKGKRRQSPECDIHEDCKAAQAGGGIFDFVKCPWCGYEVSTSNPCNWCASCYVIFRLEDGWAHFSKSFRPTTAQAWARALAKSGGASIGKTHS